MNKFMNFDSHVQAAFDNDETKYVSFNKLLIDAGLNKVQQYSKDEANAKIVEMFQKAIGVDASATKAQIRKAIRRNQVAIFDLIEESVQDLLVSGWQASPFFNEFVDTRNIAIGDKNEFYIEDNSVLSVQKVSGNHHDLIRQRLGRGETVSVPTSWYGVKIYAEFERLMTGAEDWAGLVAKVAQAYGRYVNEALYQALVGVGAALAGQWKKTGALSETTAATLRALCQDVAMATGTEVAIMGTRTALSSVVALQNVSWASDDMKNEMNKVGRLGYWEGIRLVEIPQGFKQNDTTTYLVDNTMLFVMPMVSDNKFIKLVNEGDSQVTQVVDQATHMDMTYDLTLGRA